MTDLYLEPRTIDEAVAVLAEHGVDAKVVAGGTDLVVLARKRRTALAPVLVAIHRIDELAGVGETSDGGIRIGASTAHALIERDPWIVERFTALADGSALVGSPSTRHVGTLGGNLANASPANDTGSPLLVFDASVELTSATGVRTVPLDAFFEGPDRPGARGAPDGGGPAAAHRGRRGERVRPVGLPAGHGDRRGGRRGDGQAG